MYYDKFAYRYSVNNQFRFGLLKNHNTILTVSIGKHDFNWNAIIMSTIVQWNTVQWNDVDTYRTSMHLVFIWCSVMGILGDLNCFKY